MKRNVVPHLIWVFFLGNSFGGCIFQRKNVQLIAVKVMYVLLNFRRNSQNQLNLFMCCLLFDLPFVQLFLYKSRRYSLIFDSITYFQDAKNCNNNWWNYLKQNYHNSYIWYEISNWKCMHWKLTGISVILNNVYCKNDF